MSKWFLISVNLFSHSLSQSTSNSKRAGLAFVEKIAKRAFHFQEVLVDLLGMPAISSFAGIVVVLHPSAQDCCSGANN